MTDSENPLQPVHPVMVQLIENNLLLKQVMSEVQDIKVKQETNHLVALQLRDHDTIKRVDQLWQGFGSFRFLFRTIAILLGGIPLTAAGLTASHYAWGWPR